MNHEVSFDSIESAHEFATLFAQVVLETKRDIEAHLQEALSANFPRRVEALQIIAYLLETLEIDIKNSCRILNDLRSLRRLLCGERANGTMAVRVSRSDVSGSAVARDASTHVRVKRRALSSGRTADARNPVSVDVIPWYVRRDKKPTRGTTTVKAA